MSSDDKKFHAGNFNPVNRDLKNFGPTPPKGKDRPDPMKKPPFPVGKPTGQKPPEKKKKT
jgi:hypothetical protein